MSNEENPNPQHQPPQGLGEQENMPGNRGMAPKSMSSMGPGWIGVIVACVITAMVSVGTMTWLGRNSTGPSGAGRQDIVFVDPQKLIDAKLADLLNKGVPNDEAAKKGLEFGKDMTSAISTLKNEGFLVLHAGALLAANDDRDITADIAKRLGVTLGAKIDGKKVFGQSSKEDVTGNKD